MTSGSNEFSAGTIYLLRFTIEPAPGPEDTKIVTLQPSIAYYADRQESSRCLNM